MTCYILVCFENNPEHHDGIISGAQDSIGICVPGLVRHYYDNNFWPEKIESTQDEMTLRFLEDHLVMIPMEPRRPVCSVVEGKEQSLLHVGLCPWHPRGAESAFPGVVSYQQGDVGLDAGCCLWCLLSDGAACRIDYPEVGLQEESDNRTGSLRYRCSDVHTGKQNQPVAVAQWYRMDCRTAGWRTASVLGCQHCHSSWPGGYLRAFCGAGSAGLCHPHLYRNGYCCGL